MFELLLIALASTVHLPRAERDTDASKFSLEPEVPEIPDIPIQVTEINVNDDHPEGLTDIWSILHLSEDEDSTSAFWHAAADAAVSQHVKQCRQKIMDDERMMSLMQTGDSETARAATAVMTGRLDERHMAALGKEHFLVRNAVLKALEKPARQDIQSAPEVDLKCARSVAAVKEETGSKTDTTTDEPSSDEPSISANMQKFVRKAFNGIKRRFGDLQKFLMDQVGFAIAFNVLTFGMPAIQYACQPLSECLYQLAMVGARFALFLLEIIGVVKDAIKALVMAAAKALTSALGARVDSTVDDDIPKNVMADDDEDEVNMHDYLDSIGNETHKLVDRTKELGGPECAQCMGRITGVVFPVPSVFIGLTPRPLGASFGANGGNCASCIGSQVAKLAQAISGKQHKATQDYFKKGKCNAHTVGMCMLLEKAGTCTKTTEEFLKADTQSAFFASEPRRATQSEVCKAMSGVTLELVQVESGPVCPLFHDDIMRELGIHSKPFSQDRSGITEINMHEGCLAVQDALQEYNVMCEQQHYVYSSRLFGGYKHAVTLTSVEDAAQKCRTLYGCPEEEEEENMPGQAEKVSGDALAQTFDDVEDQIRDIIRAVDGMGYSPQRLDAITATSQITSLFKQTTGSMQGFEKGIMTASVLDRLSAMEAKWGRNLETVFFANVWDDRCFAGLSQSMDARAGRKGKPATYRTYMAKLYGEWAGSGPSETGTTVSQGIFFHRFAKKVGYHLWDGKCLLPKLVSVPRNTKTKAQALWEASVNVQHMKILLYAKGDPQWKTQATGGSLTLILLGGFSIVLKAEGTQWKLQHCHHASCDLLPVSSTSVERFAIRKLSTAEMLAVAKSTDQVLRDLIELRQKQLSSPAAASWQAAHDELLGLQKALEGGTADFSRLHELVKAAPGLKSALANRGYTFTKLSAEGTKPMKHGMVIFGQPVTKPSQLKPAQSFMHIHSWATIHEVQKSLRTAFGPSFVSATSNELISNGTHQLDGFDGITDKDVVQIELMFAVRRHTLADDEQLDLQ